MSNPTLSGELPLDRPPLQITYHPKPAVWAFIYTVLKSLSEKHKRLQKHLKSGPEDKDASNPPLSNNNKPASQQSKPTLNRSGNVIANLKGEMAIPDQDYIKGRKKAETTRAFASEPRTTTDNDNDKEELAGLSSMVLEPIDTADIDKGDISMADLALNSQYLPNDSAALPVGDPTLVSMQASTPIDQMMQAMAQFSSLEYASLPLGLQQAAALFAAFSCANGGASAPPLTPSSSLPFGLALIPTLAPTITPAITPAIACPAASVSKSDSQAALAVRTLRPKPPVKAVPPPPPANPPTVTPAPAISKSRSNTALTRPVPPVTEPIDNNNNTLNDVLLAPSSNPLLSWINRTRW
ncbi:hypothetical protein BN14_08519 [Rhizoctonia solani AG-1 IB]|uniref:Uncharacterized protein n=1 Tax=Thanatephorus cucumeris (strain AG1-IB / isolate 7/3/14) TaxID=1108050 RepID=M5C4S8_THACB|nr:hypothetical protein BN14_08519 [Rhizoctonia solani AG-1 IB]